MIEARIIADSRAPCGSRLTTFVLTYPRWILAELNTHRVFSRNSASSRAIPVSRMIERIKQEPALPVSWGKNKRGMQAAEELSPEDRLLAKRCWHEAMNDAIGHASRLINLGVHKQIANRLLEPFAHVTTVLTATEFNNFFALRAHGDAQPEFQALAYAMLEQYRLSEPKMLHAGQWHLPFADQQIPDGLTTSQLLKIVTARCARVSYLNFEGDIDPEKDYLLHDELLSKGHMSPFEHAAMALTRLDKVANFIGWESYRSIIPNENRNRVNLAEF